MGANFNQVFKQTTKPTNVPNCLFLALKWRHGPVSSLTFRSATLVVARRQPLALDKDVKRQNASEIMNKCLN